MVKNTSISLRKLFEEFINEEVKSGRYNFISEVIRSALRLLEHGEKRKENRLKLLIKAIKADLLRILTQNRISEGSKVYYFRCGLKYQIRDETRHTSTAALILARSRYGKAT